MSKPVNLNKERKARMRDAKRAQADKNAVKFGRTKAEKMRDASERRAQITRLDQHRRET